MVSFEYLFCIYCYKVIFYDIQKVKIVYKLVIVLNEINMLETVV